MIAAVVIDTNVLIVANDRDHQAGPECITRCIEALEKARSEQVTVVDSGGRIFDEYFRNVHRAGQPGAGDYFAWWLFQNQGYPEKCELVNITNRSNYENDFEEFPHDPDLAGFHHKDRKFVAVAVASVHSPVIINASDSGWARFIQPLRNHGIHVKILCRMKVKHRT